MDRRGPGSASASRARTCPSMGFSRQEYWSGVPSPSLLILLTHPLHFPEPPASLVLCASYIPSLSSSPPAEGPAGREGSSSCTFQPALGGQVWPCPVVLWSLVFIGPLRWASAAPPQSKAETVLPRPSIAVCCSTSSWPRKLQGRK